MNVHPASNSTELQNCAIAELDARQRGLLDAAHQPFLNSLSYALHYEAQPAERVCCAADANGQIRRSGFYRRVRRCGISIIEFAGIPTLLESEVLSLLSRHGAKAGVLHRIDQPLAPKSNAAFTLAMDFTHDVIAELPTSAEAFLQSLGKKRRKHLPQYWRRLEREFPNLELRFQDGPELQLDDIVQLIAFNQARMKRLGKADATDREAQTQKRRWPLTQAQGMLCTLRKSDGSILGGTFNYIHGNEAVLIIIAHDPALEKMNIGSVVLWKTFEHLIARGCMRYHLFWGRKQYKNDFGGVDHPVRKEIISHSGIVRRLCWLDLMVRTQAPRAWRWAASMLRGKGSAQAETERSVADSEVEVTAERPR